ncbi:MAG: HD domain-containing protein [Oscillospiraceae bacterium]|nr:HD domain-containing protein [Oscillospiraceae bacterium]
MNEEFDFYSKTSLKSYNLNETMRYQLGRLDSLDVFTRKHCENVASLTSRLCEHLGLNPNFTVYAIICAYLHDIGKMFIPPAILQKNDKLTAEEYEIMKTHAIKGYNMCMADSQLTPYANGPLYHHEALNGTGYPHGVTIDDIPLEGQIIRVADEYDAIVNKRQYKSHVGISDTLKIIIENSNPVSPSPNENLDRKMIKIRKTYGKINKRIVKKLLEIVIFDIEVEINSVKEYLNFLKSEINRLQTIYDFHNKALNANKESDKSYYVSGCNELFSQGEDFTNYQNILADYQNTFNIRTNKINDLYTEINIVKGLRV